MFIQLTADFEGLGVSASAHHCYFCGGIKGDRHPGVVSTGVDIDGEGKLELCVNCGLEIAGLLGCIPEDKAQELRQKNRALGMQVHALLKSRDAAEAQLQALRDEVESLRDALKK